MHTIYEKHYMICSHTTFQIVSRKHVEQDIQINKLIFPLAQSSKFTSSKSPTNKTKGTGFDKANPLLHQKGKVIFSPVLIFRKLTNNIAHSSFKQLHGVCEHMNFSFALCHNRRADHINGHIIFKKQIVFCPFTYEAGSITLTKFFY
jgi:hypothetical protein